MVVGYSNVSNQDRPTTSRVCSSWRLCKIRGATTTRLEVHRHKEEEAGYNNVTNQDRLTTSLICLSWWLCWIRGATTTRLEVHGHGEEEAGYKMRGGKRRKRGTRYESMTDQAGGLLINERKWKNCYSFWSG